MDLIKQMNNCILNGEKLRCTYGTEEAIFNVTPKNTTIRGEYAASLVDCKVPDNISSFGMCMANPNNPEPCKMCGNWGTYNKYIVIGEEDVFALKRKSKLLCKNKYGLVYVDTERDKGVKKTYKKIFGETEGEELAGYMMKIAEINEAGIDDSNREEFEKLIKAYRELLDEAGGIEKIEEYNSKIMDKEGIKKEIERRDRYYEKVNKKINFENKMTDSFEEEIIKRFEACDIDREMYEFEYEPEKTIRLCNRVHIPWWKYMKDIDSDNAEEIEKVYDRVISQVLMEKAECDFEKGKINKYINNISVEADGIGSYHGFKEDGKFEFRLVSMEEQDKDRVKSLGYSYYSYDYYQGYFVYIKRADESIFEKLVLTILEREEDGSVVEKVVKIDIPEELREKIIAYLKVNSGLYRALEIVDYEIFNKIEQYFYDNQ